LKFEIAGCINTYFATRLFDNRAECIK